MKPKPFLRLPILDALTATLGLPVYDLADGLWKRIQAGAVANAARRSIDVTLTSDQNDWNPTGLSAADEIRVTPSITGNIIKVTGLQGGASGRLITLRNVSGTNWLILSGEDAASTAAYRFLFGALGPVVCLGYLESITLIYDSTLSRWTPFAHYSADYGTKFVYIEPILDLTTTLQTSVSTGTATRAPGGYFGQSEVSLTTGAAANGRAGFGTKDMALLAATIASPLILQSSLYTSNPLSDGTNTYTIRAGFLDSISAEPTDGVFLRYVHSANSGKWLFVARQNGSESTYDTGITFAVGTTYYYAIVIYGGLATPAADLYLGTDVSNIAKVATAVANIPVGTSRAFGVGTSILHGGAGTSARTMWAYPFSVWMSR